MRGTTAIGVAVLLTAWLSRVAEAEERGLTQVMKEATAAREAGDLPRALELLNEAYAFRHVPEILNNIGRVLEELGRYKEACDTYLSVTQDPAASDPLRKLDKERIASLEPKLDTAWLRFDADSRGPALLDAREIGAGEVSLAPGVHLLEVRGEDGELLVRFLSLARGLRTTIGRATVTRTPEDGCLELRGAPPSRLEVSGHPLGSRLDDLRALCMSAGRYRLNLSGRSADVEVRSGQEVPMALSLADPVAAVETRVPDSAPAGRSYVGPLALGGAGAALLAVGIGLFVSAQSDRNVINDATRVDGVIQAPPTMRDAWNLEQGAEGKDRVGLGMTIGGGAALVAGLVWWLLSPARAP
jgi:hypothetical protein